MSKHPETAERQIRRRKYLTTIGAATSVLTLAGCSGASSEVDGELVVDETVIGNSQFTFDASEGNTINVWAENTEGGLAVVTIAGPEDVLDSMEVETENTMTVTAETTGAHTAVVQQSGTAGEAEIQVGVES